MKTMFYNAYIVPLLDYCCHIWGTCQRKNAIKIIKLQKRAARLVLNQAERSNSECILQSMGWLNFDKRCRYHAAVLIHKTINNMTPSYMNDVITISKNQSYTLRSQTNNDLTLPYIPRTNYGKNTFTFYGMRVWNELPLEIRNISNNKTFKNRVKYHLLQEK